VKRTIEPAITDGLQKYRPAIGKKTKRNMIKIGVSTIARNA
jgi:hypothetical protein